MKTCIKCNTDKDIEEFSKGKKVCKTCAENNRVEYKKAYNKKYMEENCKKYNDNRKEYRKEYYKDNKDKILLYSKEYLKKDGMVEKENNRKKIYYENNKDKINKHLVDKYNTDILYKVKRRMRNILNEIYRNNGFKRNSKTEQILGCSYEYFITHIENKFDLWMNWANYGKYNGEFQYGWDYDHIIPLSNATNHNELIKLSHYTNISPLCSKINRDIKKDRLDY